MKKSFFNICNIYVFLWFVMKTDGFLYNSVAVSVVSYIIIIAISLFYAIKCYTSHDNPSFVKIYNVLFLFFCVYGSINLLVADANTTFNHIPPDFYLQNIVKSMIPFYAFYAFAKQKLISVKWICAFSLIFASLTIVTYYTNEQQLLANTIGNAEGVTNNVGYSFVSLLPLVCFWNNKKIVQYLYLAVCSFFIIMSMKRGAIIVGLTCIMAFLFQSTKLSSKRTRLFTIVLSIAVLVVGYYFVVSLVNTNAFFDSRINDTLEGNSSQRNVLYSYYWNLYWEGSTPLQYMFGRGADGTIHTGNNYAHNDWLEILIDQGLLGIILFVVFWFHLVKLWKKYPSNNVKLALGMCIISMLLRTFFSMSINSIAIYISCLLGVAIAAFQDNDYMSSLVES